MLKWVLRVLGHLLAVLVLIVMLESVVVGLGYVISMVVGEDAWRLSRLVALDFGALIGALVHMVPFTVGVLVAMPVYRVLSALGWPRRLRWSVIAKAALCLIVIGWVGFALAVADVLRPAEMSLLFWLVVLIVPFMFTVIAQYRAEREAVRKAEAEQIAAFE